MNPSEPLARLDLGRRQRLGMIEAIWGETKDVATVDRAREKPAI